MYSFLVDKFEFSFLVPYALQILLVFISYFVDQSCMSLSAELFGALRGRLSDSNKNLVMSTLTCVGNVATAMGPAVEKASKVVDSN